MKYNLIILLALGFWSCSSPQASNDGGAPLDGWIKLFPKYTSCIFNNDTIFSVDTLVYVAKDSVLSFSVYGMPAFRAKGRLLVRCVSSLAGSTWGYKFSTSDVIIDSSAQSDLITLPLSFKGDSVYNQNIYLYLHTQTQYLVEIQVALDSVYSKVKDRYFEVHSKEAQLINPDGHRYLDDYYVAGIPFFARE